MRHEQPATLVNIEAGADRQRGQPMKSKGEEMALSVQELLYCLVLALSFSREQALDILS
jgi:hypothetical protein